MYELFTEWLNQIFWEGYAEQKAQSDPAGLHIEYAEFLDAYHQ